jgi:hypothetical protein
MTVRSALNSPIDYAGQESNFGAQLVHNRLQMRCTGANESAVSY